MSSGNQSPSTPSPAPVTSFQFWTGLITLLATSVILPMWQMWLSSQHETNRQADVKQVVANQIETHAAIQSAATKVEEVHEATTKVAEAVGAAAPGTGDK